MNDLRVAARPHVCIIDVVRRLHEEVAHTSAAVVYHVPFPWQIQHVTFAVRVEHILVVVDELVIRCVSEPLLDGVMLTHRLGIEYQHASLEVIVGVLHLQHGLRVIHTLTMLYVQIAKEIDIAHCAK